MSKKSKLSLALGTIILLAAILIYGIVQPPLYLSTIIGFSFLLFSVIVFFGGFVLIDRLARHSSPILQWAGNGAVNGIYAAVVFVSSLICINTQTDNIKAFIIFQVIWLVLAILCCLIISHFAGEVKKKNADILKADAAVQSAIDKLVLIREETGRKSEIDKLIDGLKYSDTSVTVDADAQIADAIQSLQLLTQPPIQEDEFLQSVQALEILITKRNLQAKAAKQPKL